MSSLWKNRRGVPLNALIGGLALIGSVLVAAPMAATSQNAEPEGVEPNLVDTTADGTGMGVDSHEMSFLQGANVTVPDAAIQTQGDRATIAAAGDPNALDTTVKEFRTDFTFSVFALTWLGPRDSAVFFRALTPEGTWGPWYDAAPLDLGFDEDNPLVTHGTDPIYIEKTQGVQVSMNNIDMNNPIDQATIKAVFIDGDPESTAPDPAPAPESAAPDPAPAPAPGLQIALTASTLGKPTVISRKGWGADESWRGGFRAETASPVNAIVIHHTAGSNNYTQKEAPGIVRSIYKYHAVTLGWGDIGYHALVDKYGNIYEGRAGGLTRDTIGAHTGGFNENTWGISMMGNLEEAQPTQAMIDSVGQLAGWRAAVAGFDPSTSDTFYSEGSSYTFIPYGQAVTLPRIFAHRDVGTTACPGTYGYAKMGEIRQIAAKNWNYLGGTSSGARLTTNTGSDTTSKTPADSVTGLLNLSEKAKQGDETAILAIVGTILALVIGFLSTTNGNVNLSSGEGLAGILKSVKLSDLPAILDSLNAASSVLNPEAASAIGNLAGVLGPILGAPTSTVQYASGTDTTFQTFDNGIITSNPAAGTHALWGAIGDAWARQGFDAGPLGLPVTEEFREDGSPLIRVNFQFGAITFDPATGLTRILPA
ncbi:MAG: N-acetylmuramoyl-L-alanine amidase [Corynebacterium sp.]|nr:N-acetylmuramoyl-L-alanine amidase [Corynebacterium sp.]